jgi:hypothetical protein
VLLHRLRVELALMREFGHHSCFDSLEDRLLVLAEKFAKLCKFGIVHFRCHSLGQCYYGIAWGAVNDPVQWLIGIHFFGSATNQEFMPGYETQVFSRAPSSRNLRFAILAGHDCTAKSPPWAINTFVRRLCSSAP